MEKIGSKPIFVFLPFAQMWLLFPKEVREEIYDSINKSVKLTGIPIINLTYIEKKYVPDDFVVNSFDPHPNEKIHEEFAETICNWLLNNNEYINFLNNN